MHLLDIILGIVGIMPLFLGVAEGDPPPPPPPPPEDWKKSLPENIRGEKVFENVKDQNDLAIQFVNAQKLIGTDKIAKPNEKWTKEQWDEHYAVVGRPESSDKYQVPEQVELDKVGLDKDSLDAMKKSFHAAGLTQRQVKEIMTQYVDMSSKKIASLTEAYETQRRQTEETLRKEYGSKYETNVQIAASVVKQFGDEQTLEFLDKSGLGNNPEMIRLMNKVGQAMLEDTAPGEGPKLNVGGKAEALQAIADLKGDSEFQNKLMNRDVPGHADALLKWNDMHKRAYPGKEESQ